MEPDGIEMGEQVDRHPRKTRWGVGRTGGADGTGRTLVSEASGVPAKAGLRTEATPPRGACLQSILLVDGWIPRTHLWQGCSVRSLLRRPGAKASKTALTSWQDKGLHSILPPWGCGYGAYSPPVLGMWGPMFHTQQGIAGGVQ